MHTIPQATAVAVSLIGSTHDPDGSSWASECCHSVGIEYGFSHSGFNTALEHWAAIPSQYKHPWPVGNKPPVGAMCFYQNPKVTGEAGHETFSFGDGTMLSNDLVKTGRLDRVLTTAPYTKWGYTPLGFTDPWFSLNEFQLLGDNPMSDATTAAAVWATKYKEYVDENGNGTRDMRTTADILFAAHANAWGANQNAARILNLIANGMPVTLTDQQITQIIDGLWVKFQSAIASG